MSCECSQNPCTCELCITDPVNPNPNCCTVCTLDVSNNIWFTPGHNGFPGTCKLDQLTFEQVIRLLETYPFAARDLVRITDDPLLIDLARTVKFIIPEKEENRAVALRLGARKIPFYTLFKGNLGGNPGKPPVR